MAELRRRLRGVRPRTTLIAVLVVGAALGAATYGLIVLTSNRIESSIEASAGARADSLVAIVAAGALEDPLPGRDPELLSQVVDGAGTVLAADRAMSGVPPITDVRLAPGERRLLELDDVLEGFEDREAGVEDEGPYAVVVVGVELSDGPGLVIVASSLEDAAEARNALLPLLGLGLPLVLVIVGVLVWVLTGVALRPVDRMRAEADLISEMALDRRLPLPEARDELRSLARTLNEMLDRLEESAVRRSRFVSDASHELKSPLATLRAMADVAGSGSVDEQFVTDLRDEVDRMSRLVTDLLYLARHDEAGPRPRDHEVDLDHVAMQVARTVPAEVAIDTSGIEPARIWGDPDRIEQLLRNLVENAVRHADSTVWITTGDAGHRATVTVRDDGPGIPQEEAERVFERFVRLDESRARDTGGSGLGLSVARAIAHDHRGELVLAPDTNGGAMFVASFPIDR